MPKTRNRHPLQTFLIVPGIALLALAGGYLVGGLLGLFPLETDRVAWNNVRIISGGAILGCLMAAVGYANE